MDFNGYNQVLMPPFLCFLLILPKDPFNNDLIILWTKKMKALYTILLLILSNIFMTIAGYGHLKFNEINWFKSLGLPAIILISWGVALFEYSAQVLQIELGLLKMADPLVCCNIKLCKSVNQQRFRADVFQIPCLHKALFVVCNAIRHLHFSKSRQHNLDYIT